MTAQHKQLEDFIWGVANKLRGPYRPPQYRRVMLPLIVLRRMDCVLADDKAKILKEYEKLKAQDHSDEVIHKILGKKAAKDRTQPLYNVSKYDFEKLLADPDNIARNLIDYIQGLSPKAKDIFDKFGFEQEIEILDNANRLFSVIKEFAAIDLHPDKINNMQMGHIFENLIRRFNEAANEEAGDHFTPREVNVLRREFKEPEHRVFLQKLTDLFHCKGGGIKLQQKEGAFGEEEIFDLVINSKFFHGDEDKRQRLALLDGNVLQPFVRTMFQSAMVSKYNAIMYLNDFIEQNKLVIFK